MSAADATGWGRQTAESSPLRFTGRDRQGTGRCGATSTGNVAAFVETRYRQGWREMVVFGVDGEQLGGIGPHPDTGARTWWGDTGE